VHFGDVPGTKTLIRSPFLLHARREFAEALVRRKQVHEDDIQRQLADHFSLLQNSSKV
jgi:hypothetical protein